MIKAHIQGNSRFRAQNVLHVYTHAYPHTHARTQRHLYIHGCPFSIQMRRQSFAHTCIRTYIHTYRDFQDEENHFKGAHAKFHRYEYTPMCMDICGYIYGLGFRLFLSPNTPTYMRACKITVCLSWFNEEFVCVYTYIHSLWGHQTYIHTYMYTQIQSVLVMVRAIEGTRFYFTYIHIHKYCNVTF